MTDAQRRMGKVLCEKGGLEISCNWPFWSGNVHIFFPPHTTGEQRADFFEKMAEAERSALPKVSEYLE